MSSSFPDKMYYKIGEVAKIAGVRTSVLRFWETEFDFLKPEKSPTGQRLYLKSEVELVLEVKHLLYVDKFTLEGVKKRISPRGKKLLYEQPAANPDVDYVGLLREVRSELNALRCQL